MEITIKGDEKEIAAFVLAAQKRTDTVQSGSLPNTNNCAIDLGGYFHVEGGGYSHTEGADTICGCHITH